MSLNLLAGIVAIYGVALFFILRHAGLLSGRKRSDAVRPAGHGNSRTRSNAADPRSAMATSDLNEEIRKTEARLNELRLERLRRQHATGRDRPKEPYRGRVDDHCRALPVIPEDP